MYIYNYIYIPITMASIKVSCEIERSKIPAPVGISEPAPSWDIIGTFPAVSKKGISSTHQIAEIMSSCGKISHYNLQCEAPSIAKLVNITPITMVYGTYIISYWGL